MSPISTSVLFHFTSQLDNLLSILTDEFRPHYCVEDLSPLRVGRPRRGPRDADDPFRLAIPLVSFCDIPLSQAAEHMKTYGNYGLGLSKGWGLQCGLAPVLYTHSNAATLKAIEALARHAKEGGVSRLAVLTQATRLLCFSKPYEGRFLRGDTWIEDVCFYNEREWRYVPPGEPFRDFDLIHVAEGFDKQAREEANRSVWEARIPFSPWNIRYVIVEKEEEILPTIKEIERIKEKYSQDQVKVLSSRLVSAEQVRLDF